MEAKELIEKLRNWNDGEEEQGYYDSIHRRIAHQDIDQDKLKEDFGDFEYKLMAERGSTGDHDSCTTVIYFKEHDVYLALEGWYSSQEGSMFEDDNWHQVYPKQITRTIYTTKKE
jgi:hypothetical protein